MAATFEDNNPFAGAEEASADLVASTGLQSAIATNGDDSADGSNGYPSFQGSYDTSSHDGAEPRPGILSFQSKIQQMLTENPDLEILIVDAGKSREGSGGGFIAYTVRTGDLSVRRRYSDFESLRNALVRLFPTLIIPPIPEKHSMSDYAAAPTKAKEDLTIIEHRRRMLAIFLNRCRSMHQIRLDGTFQKFLDPNVSWSEVLISPPISLLPRFILRAPPLDPAADSPGHAYLPIPSSSARLKYDNALEFQVAETNAKEYEAVMSNGLEKVNKRMLKRLTDMAVDFADLGAQYNAWSLNESNSLATAIERTGQAIDGTYIATEELVSSLSSTFSEPLAESAQFAGVVRSVLKYRHQKALQHEMTLNSLAVKSNLLEQLEKTELESQRINDYLENRDSYTIRHAQQGGLGDMAADGVAADAREITHESLNQVDADNSGSVPSEHSESTNNTSASNTSGYSSRVGEIPANGDELGSFGRADDPYVGNSIESSLPLARPRRSKGFKFPGISKLNHAIHGMIDVDPESTRRNNIGKTREQVQILKSSLEVTELDLKQASESIKADLERYEQTRERDLRKMMVAYAKCHIEWARKNLEIWEEAKLESEKIKVK
ncbi:uncharacterized protein V1510DRAFT_410300 [Dipodascopsis tothii]|uniref:uncharacterized protein n=1 Tax=Dipodascopsis tothii TaxID=44089 RepID=UPI0034CE1311